MNWIDKIGPTKILRATLGAMYLYSGIDLIQHPTAWTWALPPFAQNFIKVFVPLATYIRFQGFVELAIAAILILLFIRGAIVRWVALLSAAEMATILLFAFMPFKETMFVIVFRDIGIFGAALALFTLHKEQGLSPQAQAQQPNNNV